jgi:hypothetical protein
MAEKYIKIMAAGGASFTIVFQKKLFQKNEHVLLKTKIADDQGTTLPLSEIYINTQ